MANPPTGIGSPGVCDCSLEITYHSKVKLSASMLVVPGKVVHGVETEVVEVAHEIVAVLGIPRRTE